MRFYKYVDVIPHDGSDKLYKIMLDGRNLKTPARNTLHLPNAELASMIALEWDAQLDKSRGIVPASMPYTILASTALDQIRLDPNDARRTCLRFLPTDSTLFFTTPEDRILLKAQKKHFHPLHKWIKRALGVELKTTDNMGGRVAHPQASVERVTRIIESLDHFELACLQSATMECKSVVIALALMCRYIDFEQAKAAARVEEEFQAEIWGVVEGGHDMDRLNTTVGLSAVDAFMSLYWDESKVEEKMKLFQSL